MSRENVEIVRRVFDAVSRRDSATAFALYDPDIEWDVSRVRWGDFTGPGVYHGHDEMRRVYRDWYDVWENYEEEVEDLIDCGENVISVVTARGRGRSSGVEVEYTTCGVWTFRDGKVVRTTWFPSRGEALEAVGLRE